MTFFLNICSYWFLIFMRSILVSLNVQGYIRKNSENMKWWIWRIYIQGIFAFSSERKLEKLGCYIEKFSCGSLYANESGLSNLQRFTFVKLKSLQPSFLLLLFPLREESIKDAYEHNFESRKFYSLWHNHTGLLVFTYCEAKSIE